MHRNLIAVAATFVLSGCVIQPPPGYWTRQTSPYSPPYYQPTNPQGWNAPPVLQPSFAPPTRVSWAPPPEYGGAEAGAYGAHPVSYSPPPNVDPATSGNDSPNEQSGPAANYAEETVDYGVPPTNTLHLHDFDAPTPTRVEGAHTITTVELERMLASNQPPVLIDVIGGSQTVSLPNAVWLRDAGVGRHLDDDVQAWFDLHLSQLTGHDKTRPLVFFCASRLCWLAHNATLRALDLGYTNVSWYRGGRDAWQAAGLPMAPVAPPVVDN